jgi:serine protease AprX
VPTETLARTEFTFPPEYRERRVKLRVRDEKTFYALRAPAASLLPVRVANPRRRYLTFAVDSEDRVGTLPSAARGISIEDVAERYDATVEEVFQFDIDTNVFDPESIIDPSVGDASMDEVLRLIKADVAQRESRGKNVVIAIVDSGIDGSRHEFDGRHAGEWQMAKDMPWTDWLGHGTMCATIAAASTATGGEFQGVAPEADLVACRTYFKDDELAACYDYLIDMAQAGTRVVISNSFGIESGTPPTVRFLEFTAALEDALGAGALVIFAAGNYHELTGAGRKPCSPTSIWQFKCREDVLTVGTCKLDGTMWEYSSRGPGHPAGVSPAAAKPDVIAPTPVNGRILVGNNVYSLRRGWGTSGACPQVAGLAALLWSKKPGASAADVANVIRSSADSTGADANCQGAGIINCERALSMI